MKKVIATIATVILAASLAQAQDLAEITEIYNGGAASLQSGDKNAALEAFNKALNLATALGDEGKDVVTNCQNAIPSVTLSLAKDMIKAKQYDSAIEKLKAAVEAATKFNAADVIEDANTLIPQVFVQKGTDILKTDPKAAAAAFQQALDIDATNGGAALRLGMALNAAGDTEGAISAFEKAAENGQEANATKQISNIYLKMASAALKAKKYPDAVDAALNANEYVANPQAIQIAGQASQLAGKTADAIKYFTQYLEVAGSAANAGQIAYTVGALYQQSGNNAKAKEFYQKASTDPKYGAEAKKMLDALK